MKLTLLSTAALLAAVSLSAAPIACPVATLAVYTTTIDAGGGCTLDGLLFNNFTYIPSSLSPGVAVPASGVAVNPLLDVNGSGFGFQITAGFATIAPGIVDSILEFTVQTISGAATISGLNAVFNGTHTGTGIAGVSENYCPGGTTVPPGPGCAGGVKNLLVESADGVNILSASATFTPVTTLSISKDIQVNGGAGPGTATISSVTDQFVNGSVPEPGTVFLLSAGLAAIFGLRNRKS